MAEQAAGGNRNVEGAIASSAQAIGGATLATSVVANTDGDAVRDAVMLKTHCGDVADGLDDLADAAGSGDPRVIAVAKAAAYAITRVFPGIAAAGGPCGKRQQEIQSSIGRINATSPAEQRFAESRTP